MRTRVLLAAGLIAALNAAIGSAAEADLGRDIAANCASCHGTDGRSHGGIPGLAGRDKAFIVERLREYRAGARASTVMGQLAKGYSDPEIDAAAAYFARQKPAPNLAE